MQVSNYIYSKFNERGMRSFETKVKRMLKGIDYKNVICRNAYLERANGYSSYNCVAEIQIDNETYLLKSHTNNSEFWDNFEPTDKNKRNLFLGVLENELTTLKENLCKI